MRRSSWSFVILSGSLLLLNAAARAQSQEFPEKTLTGPLTLSGGPDFPVAFTTAVEQAPAIAYNSQTGQFLVAYRIQYTDLSNIKHWGVLCQLLNANGTKSGSALYPFGDLGTIDAIGRPALAYDKTHNIFFLAVPERLTGYDRVIGRFLNGDGSNRVGPDFLFNDSALSPIYDVGSWLGTNSLHVVYNDLLGEFLVTVQREVTHYDYGPVRHNTIAAQRISESAGTSSIVELVDYGLNGIHTHSIAYAPVPGTSPSGGRYLFVEGSGSPGVALLDSQLNEITWVPITWGTPDSGVLDHSVAYGEVDGRNLFLVAFRDDNNCAPHHTSCGTGPENAQWTGIWGTYVDPLVTSYPPGKLDDRAFPISMIDSHVIAYTQGPRLSYGESAGGFFAVWKEAPALASTDDQKLTHIRGAFVDYYVEIRDLAPDPVNVILSDVTGTPCTTGYFCPSDQDPEFPDVAGIGGTSGAFVWHQKWPANPSDYDVMGDIYTATPSKPDLVESSVSNPPASATAGTSFSVTDTVNNNGAVSAAASTTAYYLSLDTAKDGADVQLTGTRSVPLLEAFDTSSGTVTVKIPSATAAGSYYLMACADNSGLVSESSESNNCIGSATKIAVSAMPPPTVTITASDDTATEAGATTAAFAVTRTGGDISLALTVYYTVGGTATSGSDYTALSGTVVIPAGRPGRSITVTPVDDTAVEGEETVIVTLSTNAAYTRGTPYSATVKIVDNDTSAKPTVTIVATDPTATEAGPTAGTFTISRTGSTTAALTVYYGISGTSTGVSDRNGLPVSKVIPAGSSSVSIVITPVDDTLVEGDETVILTLTANAAYTVGSPSSATVTIVDNDTSAKPIIIDNAGVGQSDGARSFTGTWCVSSSSGFYGTNSLYSCGAGAHNYRWTPTIPSAGSYSVYVWWTSHSQRSTAVPISVSHAEGVTTKTYNQQLSGGQWILHGTYNFNAGTTGYADVSDDNGQACADAVRFVPVP